MKTSKVIDMKEEFARKKGADELREKFIKKSEALMERYIQYSMGELDEWEGSLLTANEIWTLMARIIEKAGDTPRVRIRGTTTDEQVEDIKQKVLRGRLSVSQGKELIEFLTVGTELIELPKLMEKLEQLEESK